MIFILDIISIVVAGKIQNNNHIYDSISSKTFGLSLINYVKTEFGNAKKGSVVVMLDTCIVIWTKLRNRQPLTQVCAAVSKKKELFMALKLHILHGPL